MGIGIDYLINCLEEAEKKGISPEEWLKEEGKKFNQMITQEIINKLADE